MCLLPHAASRVLAKPGAQCTFRSSATHNSCILCACLHGQYTVKLLQLTIKLHHVVSAPVTLDHSHLSELARARAAALPFSQPADLGAWTWPPNSAQPHLRPPPSLFPFRDTFAYIQEALRAAASIEDLMAYQEVCFSPEVFLKAGILMLDCVSVVAVAVQHSLTPSGLPCSPLDYCNLSGMLLAMCFSLLARQQKLSRYMRRTWQSILKTDLACLGSVRVCMLKVGPKTQMAS